MNRPKFAQIGNKTTLGQQGNKFFNVSQIHPGNYHESDKYAAKIKQTRDRLDLDGKIRSIVYSVHEQLRVRQSSTSPSRVKPKSSKDRLRRKLRPKKQNSTMQEKNTQSDTTTDNDTCDNISIPRMKVLCSDKHKDCCNKATETSSNCLSYKNYKKMLLAQQRKTELENMTKEHKLLIEDHRSLEQDIFALRHFLNDLQHRVQCSFQQLHNKRTFCECHGLLNNENCKNCQENT